MDYFLTEEQEMIKELCQQIAEEKLKPMREHHDETGEFPWDAIKAFKDADLFGIAIEEQYGGMGGGCMDTCIAIEELCKVDAGIALCLFATGLGTFPIMISGNDEQKAKYLPQIAAGSLAAFGLTEANAGSDG